jgi:hypothetical protein
MKWSKVLLCPCLFVIVASVAAFGQGTNMLPNGSFESGQPSHWFRETSPSGSVLAWATDEAKTPPYSLKIERTFGDAVRWVSGNQVRYWVNDIPGGVDIKVGAWVKTSGVNTNPATEDDKWQVKFWFYDTLGVLIGGQPFVLDVDQSVVKFWFYDTLGVLIGGQPFVLDVDQSVASRDWYADTNGVGSLILPEVAARLEISAEAGTGATGTVWFDNFIFVGRAGQWAGQNWNGFVEADAGWQYWIAPGGGNNGLTYFPGSGVSTEEARTGTYSLKITAPVGRPSGELIWFTETVPIPPNSAGKKYVLSAWVKTSQIQKDSVFNASYALGFTWTWHSQMFADGGGWNEVSSADSRFVLKDTSQDWTQYQRIIEVPDNSVQAVSVRPRAYPLWTGVAYYDDFSLNGVDIVTSVKETPRPIGELIPTEYQLLQNYPNPFNPATIITYDLPASGPVRLEVFNLVGQKVSTLVNEEQYAGKWTIKWNGTDDLGTAVASGVYFYRLATPDVVLSRKMLLLK